jgi:dienelactone hydrolase
MKKQLLAIALLSMVALVPSVHAKIVTQAVPYQHEGVELEGFLAYDDAVEGKRPAVLIVHEWWGLNDYVRKRAEQLAGLGYVAFAVDMYGKGKVTEHPKEASEWAQQIRSNIQLWQQRASAGLEALKKEQRVDPNRIAAIGYCFGGSTVQQLAYTGADIKGIVSFHGSLVAPTEEQAKRTTAKIMICDGASDPMIKPADQQEYIAAMERSGLDWLMVIYGGARHSFTNPDADKLGMEALKYNKAADQRSWAHMRDFFNEIFTVQK